MIEEVELRDWKSLSELHLSFSPGINFITGPNGIGKSSILQAISVAITGEVPSWLGVETQLNNFVRKGADNSLIRVKFRVKNDLFCVERRISLRGREQCQIFDSEGREVISGRWDEVTRYIEKLIGLQIHFFDRIAYMSEGEVYRMIYMPPNRPFLEEIDRVLGISRLQSLQTEIDKLMKSFDEEEKENREILKKVEEFKEETRESLQQLLLKLNELEGTRASEQNTLREIEDELLVIKDKLRRYKEAEDHILHVDEEEKKLQAEQPRILTLTKRLKSVAEDLEVAQSDRNEVKGRISHLERVIDLIRDVEALERDEIKCPVCGKPIRGHEIEDIRTRIVRETEKLRRRIKHISTQIDELNKMNKEIEKELDSFRKKQIRLRVLKERYPRGIKNLPELRKKISKLPDTSKKLENERTRITELLAKLQSQINYVRERIGAQRAIGEIEQEDQLRRKLEIAAKGAYITNFTLKAIEESIRRQRDSELRYKLYRQLSEVWDSFKGEKGWQVRLDEHAVPQAEKADHQYPLWALSGGEKTALLVLTRIILGRFLIGEAGFLLLDEPLEHLDQRNMRALLRFLVDAYSEGLITQLIVTTVEQSLLRRFADYDFVKIIPLKALL